MKTHVLERVQVLPRPRSEIFPFFADARNLERITPPWLRFSIVTKGEIPMVPGTLIDYRLSLYGLPFSWQTRIEAFEPGREFVDVQLRGPYRLWRHTHRFEDAPGGGTRMTDRVEYALPLGPLGEAAHALFVERSLSAIFRYRHEHVERLLAPGGPALTPSGAR